jgi:hypothetical protein
VAIEECSDKFLRYRKLCRQFPEFPASLYPSGLIHQKLILTQNSFLKRYRKRRDDEFKHHLKLLNLKEQDRRQALQSFSNKP